MAKETNENSSREPFQTAVQDRILAFGDLLAMLTTSFPCEFRVGKEGKEVQLYINHGTQRSILLRNDGTWEYQ